MLRASQVARIRALVRETPRLISLPRARQSLWTDLAELVQDAPDGELRLGETFGLRELAFFLRLDVAALEHEIGTLCGAEVLERSSPDTLRLPRSLMPASTSRRVAASRANGALGGRPPKQRAPTAEQREILYGLPASQVGSGMPHGNLAEPTMQRRTVLDGLPPDPEAGFEPSRPSSSFRPSRNLEDQDGRMEEGACTPARDETSGEPGSETYQAPIEELERIGRLALKAADLPAESWGRNHRATVQEWLSAGASETLIVRVVQTLAVRQRGKGQATPLLPYYTQAICDAAAAPAPVAAVEPGRGADTSATASNRRRKHADVCAHARRYSSPEPSWDEFLHDLFEQERDAAAFRGRPQESWETWLARGGETLARQVA